MRLRCILLLVLLLLGPPSSALAEVLTTIGFNSLTYSLRDMDPDDGVTPWARFELVDTSGAATVFDASGATLAECAVTGLDSCTATTPDGEGTAWFEGTGSGGAAVWRGGGYGGVYVTTRAAFSYSFSAHTELTFHVDTSIHRTAGAGADSGGQTFLYSAWHYGDDSGAQGWFGIDEAREGDRVTVIPLYSTAAPVYGDMIAYTDTAARSYPPPVPEPAAWAMLAPGLLAIAAWLRRQVLGWPVPIGTRRKRRPTLALLGLVLAPAAAFAGPHYALTLLPQDFEAAGLNSAGQVVGTAEGGAAIWRAPGSVLSLGALLPGSEGLGINSQGDIVGRDGDHAFIYANGVATGIVTGYTSWATAINDAGMVTGTAFNYVDGGPQLAFLYAGGATTFIGPGPSRLPQSFGNAINNAGVVAGTIAYAYDAHWFDPSRQAFTYSDGALLTHGTLGGDISEAEDINDAGAMAGWSTNDGDAEELALLYATNGNLVHLGSLGGTSSRAHGLNNDGWVVGMSDISAEDGFDYHAFLYGADGMVDLNDLVTTAAGWRLVSADDINDAGQILAQSCQMSTGACRAVRLDPVAAVPEPANVILWSGGLCLLGLATRRRPRWARHAALPGLALLALPFTAQAGDRFAFTMVAPPPGFTASAMNNAGHVVGTDGNAAGIWSGSTVSTIAALAPGSVGLAINDRDDIAGIWQAQAFLRTAAGVRDLGRLGFWWDSEAVAVNNAGQVAGTGYWPVGEEWRGWVVSQGALRMIGTFGGDFSETRAINNAGQVVGLAAVHAFRSPRGDYHAFLYRDRLLVDLGTLGDGVTSRANGINDAGQVVGASEYAYSGDTSAPLHPFLYENRTMRDLGTLGGATAEAFGINNAGAVVGGSYLADGATYHAFLYEGGHMRDLNSLTRRPQGWVLTEARQINDRRQILSLACRDEDCLLVRLDPAR